MKKEILFMMMLFCTLSIYAGHPPFPQSEINALNQEQINCFGYQVFNPTTLKAILMHATYNDAELRADGYYPPLGYMHNLSDAITFMRKALASNDRLIQEITLHNGEELIFKLPGDRDSGIKTSIIWENPGGDVEFDFSADRSIQLEDDIDLRMTRFEFGIYPFVFTNRYWTEDCTTGDNTVDNMEQVFAHRATPVGLRSSEEEYYDVSTVKISHKGSLNNGAKNISIVLSGVSNTLKDNVDFGGSTKYGFARDNINCSIDFPLSSGEGGLIAGKTVTLKPGFHVKAEGGVTFTAVINPVLACKFNNSASLRSTQNTTGIDNLAETTSIKVYPNPVSDFVSFSRLQNESRVKVFTAMGKFIFESIVNDGSSIDLTNLEKGVYLFTITEISGNQTTTIKVVKN